MSCDQEIRTVRRLVGEEPRAEGTPELSETGWEELWRGLDLPPVAPPPAGFASRVVARARAQQERPLGLPLSPAWARAVATCALVAGIAGGVGLGLAYSEPDEGEAFVWNASSLAEEYLDEAAEAITPGGEEAAR